MGYRHTQQGKQARRYGSYKHEVTSIHIKVSRQDNMQDINVSNRSQADVHALSRVGQYKGPSPAAVKDVRRLYQGFIQCKYNMPKLMTARAVTWYKA